MKYPAASRGPSRILIAWALSLCAVACGLTIKTGREGEQIISIKGPTMTITAVGLEELKTKIVDHIIELESHPFPDEQTLDHIDTWHGHLTNVIDQKTQLAGASEADDGAAEAGGAAPAPQ